MILTQWVVSNTLDSETRDKLSLTDDAAFFSGIIFGFNQKRKFICTDKMEVEPKDNKTSEMEIDSIEEPVSLGNSIYSCFTYLFNQAQNYLPFLGSRTPKREHEDIKHREGPERKRKKFV